MKESGDSKKTAGRVAHGTDVDFRLAWPSPWRGWGLPRMYLQFCTKFSDANTRRVESGRMKPAPPEAQSGRLGSRPVGRLHPCHLEHQQCSRAVEGHRGTGHCRFPMRRLMVDQVAAVKLGARRGWVTGPRSSDTPTCVHEVSSGLRLTARCRVHFRREPRPAGEVDG